jgi:AcrR family transcriptional regulator
MPSGSGAGGPRRTQAERSAETIASLVDATIATIAELGFHQATTAAISARAGVSPGALFHHFESRIDLVLTALQRMTEQRISRYVEFAEHVSRGGNDPMGLLRMVGRLARDDVATVWAEITVAARTDAELRARVGPSIDARWSLIRGAAEAFPGLAAMDRRSRDVWLQLLRGAIELAPLVEPMESGDVGAREERRNRALIDLATHLGATFRPV